MEKHPGKKWLAALKTGSICLLLLVYACACAPDIIEDAFVPGDLVPPVILAWRAESAQSVRIEFSEAVSADLADFSLNGGLNPSSLETAEKSLCVLLDAGQDAGASYALSGSARDVAGNSTRFVLPFTGFNSRIPRVLINEILCEGSATHPDAVEFFAMTDGNLAGLCFSVGIPENDGLRYVFPKAEVVKGDFIILHLKPKGIPEEMDETGDITVSGGLDASPLARDFWYRLADGALPGGNAALILYESSNGIILDAVAYSERTSESDEKYGGFGTQAFRDAVDALVLAESWNISGERGRPEDCVPSGATTSTRTLCRSSASRDENTSADWHTVPTKGASLGSANTDEVYVP